MSKKGPKPPDKPKPPPRRLIGWRWKGKKESLGFIPPRDISLKEAKKNPRWYLYLIGRKSNRYFKPEFTKPERGQH